MALDLAGQLLRAEVDRVDHVPRCVAGPEGHALEMEGDLGDLRIGDCRVALLPDLDLEVCEWGDLLRDLSEPPLDVVPDVVRNGSVSPFDRDPHRTSSVGGRRDL